MTDDAASVDFSHARFVALLIGVANCQTHKQGISALGRTAAGGGGLVNYVAARVATVSAVVAPFLAPV